MKFALALTFAAAVQGITTTRNICWDGEGITDDGVKESSDLYFLNANDFDVLAGESCNWFAYGSSGVKWQSSSIKVYYWRYIDGDSNEGSDEGDSGFDDFGDFHAKLKLENDDERDSIKDSAELKSEIPTEYTTSGYRIGL